MSINIDVLDSGEHGGSVGYILSGYGLSDDKQFEIHHPSYSSLFATGVNYTITLTESGSDTITTGNIDVRIHNPYSLTIEKSGNDIYFKYDKWEDFGQEKLPDDIISRFNSETVLGLTPTQVSGLFWKYCGLMYEYHLYKTVPGYSQILWSGF